ncbi:MAG: PQQ-binding-like beta-propeller repeat protein, partial [Armatimonadota bacterium]
MVTAIADYVKARRNELGRHVLFVGGAIRTSPDEVTVEQLLQQMALEWAQEHGIALPEDEPGVAALEAMAQQVPSHLERCRRLRPLVDKRRPSEAHTRLGRMISEGYFPAIFTTDPTDLLQRALRNQHMEPEVDYHLLIAGVDPPDEIELAISGSTRVVVVKCGGSMTGEYLPLSQAEVDATIDAVGPVIASAFKTLSLFVAYTERDRAFIPHVPHEGDRVFWINRVIPMNDEDLFQELKLESPASVEYHRLQPTVTEMLAARNSARHLLCREPGEPNAFFSALEERVSRHERSTRRARKSTGLSVLSSGPFRFLDHYRVEDAELFYGREQETADVIEMIRQHKLSVLFGALGRGKTSLLCAGVMARMLSEAEEADEDHGTPWLPVYVRCGDDPLESTREALDDALREQDIEGLDTARDLREVISDAAQAVGRPIVLLLDQFEEYFVKTGDRVRQVFAEQLAETSNHNGDNLRVLISIREDYLGHLYELRELFPEILHHVYRLNKLSARQAKVAAMKPGASFHIRIEEELVDRVLEDLCHDDGCEPAELQIVMDRLYQALSPGRHVLTQHTYRALEGADRILRDYLEHALHQLPSWERRLVRNVLKQMVQSSELKAVCSVERLAAELGQPEETVERILARLVDLRLVRRVGKPEKRQYEVVHEYVVRKIDEWMTERQIEVKDVQDLLTRELGNYQKFGLLMPEGALRLIGAHRNELIISPEELALIVLSAVHREIDVGYWLGRIEELGDLLEPTISEMLHDSEAHVRLSALRALGPHVSRQHIPELVRLLDDEKEDVRALAEEYLRGLDRELVHMLGRGTPNERHLAAYALGRVESRRALRPLAQALRDDDEQMRDEVAEALMEMGPASTTRILLRRLRESPDAPWAVAYALGRVAQDPRSVAEIESARRSQPRSAQIAFALAMAQAQRREFATALELLDEAERLTTTQVGRDAVAEMREEVLTQRERAKEFEEWLTFHGDVRRTGHNAQQVTPPLRVRWRFQARGPVVGGPVVGRGMVCVGSRDSYVYGLDSASGQLRWEAQTGDRVECTPALAGNDVFVTSRDGKLYCFSLDDGKPRWSHDIGAPSRSSPAVAGGLVIAGNQEGRLTAVQARDGRRRWQVAAADEISAAPMVADG